MRANTHDVHESEIRTANSGKIPCHPREGRLTLGSRRGDTAWPRGRSATMNGLPSSTSRARARDSEEGRFGKAHRAWDRRDLAAKCGALVRAWRSRRSSV